MCGMKTGRSVTLPISPVDTGCEIDFFVDFEFKNRLLQVAIGAVFHEAVRVMVNAFQKRAKDVYGAPAKIE